MWKHTLIKGCDKKFAWNYFRRQENKLNFAETNFHVFAQNTTNQLKIIHVKNKAIYWTFVCQKPRVKKKQYMIKRFIMVLKNYLTNFCIGILFCYKQLDFAFDLRLLRSFYVANNVGKWPKLLGRFYYFSDFCTLRNLVFATTDLVKA